MKMNRFYTILLALLTIVILLPACKTSKRTGGSLNLKPKSSKFLLRQLSKNRVEAEWLSAKARATYKDDERTEKFNINFRYRKDSIIWLNVKKATVEAARIQITPDSFFLIDRLNKEYFVNSIAAIEDRFNLPQRTAVDLPLFDMLEEMLLGNPLFFAGSELESGIDEDEYTLKGKSEHFDSEYRIEGMDYLLSAMNFLPDDERQYLKVEMDRSEFIEDYPKFSYIRKYEVTDPKQGKIEIKLKFSKLELDEPKNIKFSIPGSYKKIN